MFFVLESLAYFSIRSSVDMDVHAFPVNLSDVFLWLGGDEHFFEQFSVHLLWLGVTLSVRGSWVELIGCIIEGVDWVGRDLVLRMVFFLETLTQVLLGQLLLLLRVAIEHIVRFLSRLRTSQFFHSGLGCAIAVLVVILFVQCFWRIVADLLVSISRPSLRINMIPFNQGLTFLL